MGFDKNKPRPQILEVGLRSLPPVLPYRKGRSIDGKLGIQALTFDGISKGGKTAEICNLYCGSIASNN